MYAESEQTFKDVLKVDPENRRVHFYLGRLYIRWKKMDAALVSLDKYLEFSDLSDLEIGAALYYKGNVYYSQKDYDQAESLFKEAWRTGRIKRAKSRLESIERRREKE